MIHKTTWVAVAVLALTFLCTLSAADLPYSGKWKLNSEKSYYPNAARTIEFAPHGSDGLTVRIVDLNAVCETKFDGKDYAATGPGVPLGYTLAVRKLDGRSFEMIQKMNGKTLYTSTFSVSPDGKTLTERDSANSVAEKVKAVYDRQ